MKKHLQILSLLLAMFLLPGLSHAQLLSEYTLATDTTTFQSIVSTGTSVSLSSTDDGSGSITMPFAFPFGESLLASGSSVAISANGFVNLGVATTSGTTGSYSGDTYRTINGIIAQDAHMGRYTGAGVYYQVDTVDGHACLTIEFHLLARYGTPYGVYSHQVKMYDNGTIQFVYDSVDYDGATPTLRSFLWDGPNGDLACLSTSWDAPEMMSTITSRPTTSTPVHGLRHTMARPVIACPKPYSIAISDLTSTGATVSWVDTTNAASWMLYYCPADTMSMLDSMVITDTSYTFNSCYPNTSYYVAVSSDCGDGTYSFARSVMFRTPCVAIAHDDLPYTYGFEDATATSTTGQISPCWSKGQMGGTTDYPYPSSTAHTGTKSLYFYSYSSVRSWAVLPQFEDSINTLNLRFWARRSSTSYAGWITVGVVTDPNDISTFTQVAMVKPADGSTNWEEFEIPMNTYSGTGFICILNNYPPTGAYSYNYVYVDDVTVEPIPACPHVVNVRVDSVSVDWASVSWTEVGSASSWVIEYDTVDFVPGTDGHNLSTVSDTNVMITDLDTGKAYYFYVHADCGGDTSTNKELTFSTLDALPAELPYSCNFEGEGTNGWEFINGTQVNYWMVGSATNHGGNKSMYITNDGSSNAYSNGSISYTYATRTFSIADSGEFAYAYDWKCQGESHYYDFCRVFMVPATYTFTAGINPASSTYSFATWACPAGWVELTENFGSPATMATSAAWRSASGTFRIETPGTYNLVFCWANDGSGGSNPPVAIDNVSIVHNTCPAPQDLVASYVGQDTVIITWTPGGQESSWVVSNGTDQTEVTDTTYTFTDLSANTAYTFTVSALCTGDDTSFATSVSVRTQCPEYLALPYSEDFESYPTGSGNRPSCWTAGGYSNYPYFSTYCSSTMLDMYNYWSSTSTVKTYACLPPIDTNVYPIRTLELTFSATSTSSSTGSSYPRAVIVGVCSVAGDMSTFVPVDTVTGLTYGVKSAFTVGFNNYADSNIGNIITFVSDASLGSASYNYNYVAIDDIFLAPAPTCARVLDLAAPIVTHDSVYLTWSDTNATVNGWYIEYGPSGFIQGTEAGTSEYVTDSTFAVGGLTPDTRYDFYVAADCGSDDTSYWRHIAIRTACVPIDSLPYFYGFEDATGTSTTSTISPCWYKNSTYSAGYPYPSSTAASGNYSLYFYNYAYSGGHSWAVMPLFNHQLDSLQVKFKLKRSNSSEYNYYSFDIAVGVMTDPTDLNTFTQIGTYTATSYTVWDSFVCYLAGYTGDGRYIAFKDNGDGTRYYTYVYLDDVEVDYAPDCGPVQNIAAVAGPASAMITWEPNPASETDHYTVEYREDVDGSSWTTDTTSNTYYAITGLNTNTTYLVRVANECVEGTSVYATTEFSTRRCLVGGDVTIGTGNGQVYGVPVNSSWGNTMCQSIFTASELAAAGLSAGPIGQIKYTWSTNSSYTKEFTVFMGQTATSTYGSTAAAVPLSSQMQVYNGIHSIGTTGQVTYTLDTTFVWDGTSNIVITSWMNQYGSSQSISGFYGLSTESSAVRSLYAYRDSNPYTASDGTFSYTSTSRPNIVFAVPCDTVRTCVAPVAVVRGTDVTSVDVAWAAGNTETSWNAYYKLASASNYTYAATVNTNYYTFTGLMSGTNYDFLIESVCSDDSVGASVSAVTECAKISTFPYTENFNSWGAGTGVMPNCWNRNGSYSSYPYLDASYNASGAGASMYMYLYNNGSNYCRATMPEVDTTVQPMRNLQLYFQALQTTTSYTNEIVVGVMSDPENMNTFVPVDTVSLAGRSTSTWYDFEVPFSNYTDTGAYITFKAQTSSPYTYTYIDDVVLEEIPSCQRPDSLVLDTVTTTSFTCHWRERGSATDWIIEYGPRGFQPGTGTQVAANTNPFTVTGIPSAYTGEFYVYSVCSSTDTSSASRHGCNFATCQIPATIPYTYDFENSTEYDNWQTSTNNLNVNWYRGTATAYAGTNSMYVSADSGATVSTDMTRIINSAIYRDVDFGTIDTTFEISFRYRCGGTTANRYDGLMVFLVDPVQTVEASSAAITSPWGNVNNLYRIANLRCDTSWTEFTGSFDTIHGVKRVAFFWFNQGTGDAGFEWGPCAVDDISIDYAPCPRPLNLEVDTTSITSTTARLFWDGPASATYRVAYRVAGTSASANQFATTNTNSIVLSGLTPMTTYYAWAQKICGSDSSLFSDGVAFTTTMCDNPVFAYSYDSTMTATTSDYAPMGYSFYNYGYVQTLIDSAQLASLDGPISALAFSPATSTCGDYYTNMDIYMANVSESSLSTFIVPDATHQFVQLTNGADLSYSDTGWQIAGFDSAFVWDGHSNLLIAVNRRHGSYASGASFNAHNTSNVRTVYAYNDVSAYSISNPTATSYAYTLSLVGDIQLISCGSGAVCDAPIITSVAQTYHDATATWAGTGTSYEVNIKEASATTWPADIAVASNTYTFSGLNPATYYTLRVRQDCSVDSLGYSVWVEQTFMTDSLPCLTPSALSASNMTNAEATFDWTVNGTETNWDIHVWYGSFDSIYRVNAHPATVGGFTAGVTYYAAVRALCGVDLLEGDWSDAITFTTATCPDVTGLATSNVSYSTIDLSWNADPMAQSWIIEYGNHGFNQGAGTTVTVNTNSYHVTGLSDETNYDFYVRAVCGTDWNSEGWASVSATTLIANVDSYYLTVLSSDPTMGTVTGSGEYYYGETATMTATANEGYVFTGWNDGVTDNPRSVVIVSDTTFTAMFQSEQQQGIDGINGISCTIYPNPATSSTTISVEGANGMVRIAVVDINGRTVASETIECSTDCAKTIDIDALAQGAYFVRITGENVNMVKKLIVR